MFRDKYLHFRKEYEDANVQTSFYYENGDFVEYCEYRGDDDVTELLHQLPWRKARIPCSGKCPVLWYLVFIVFARKICTIRGGNSE